MLTRVIWLKKNFSTGLDFYGFTLSLQSGPDFRLKNELDIQVNGSPGSAYGLMS
jgi:hypothetical protein